MIKTNNSTLHVKMQKLRDHAMSKTRRYWHSEIGFNYRMTNLQAALGYAQLVRIEAIIKKKKEIFEKYEDALKDIPGISLNHSDPWATNVYWMVCLKISYFTQKKRDNFIKKLKEKGIDTRPYFYPVSDIPMFDAADTPIAHAIY